MKHNDEFDKVLHDALAEYREAEPLTGLEQRVLRRVRSHVDRRQKLLWRWSAPTAAAAALAIVVWIGITARARHELAPAAVAQKGPAAAEPQRKPPESTAKHYAALNSETVVKTARSRQPHVPASSQVVSLQREPMREQFPTPAPLTSDERTLLALVQMHPAALQELPADDTDNEIAIAPIAIKPLVETADSQGEN